jgi:hypothetical protein
MASVGDMPDVAWYIVSFRSRHGFGVNNALFGHKNSDIDPKSGYIIPIVYSILIT